MCCLLSFERSVNFAILVTVTGVACHPVEVQVLMKADQLMCQWISTAFNVCFLKISKCKWVCWSSLKSCSTICKKGIPVQYAVRRFAKEKQIVKYHLNTKILMQNMRQKNTEMTTCKNIDPVWRCVWNLQE